MGVPDQSGKIAIVTGSNTGIGEVTARELAAAGARVYMACRSKSKADEATARIKGAVPNADIVFLELDLASLASVRKAAESFLANESQLDLLINNAGLAGPKGLTEEGIELTFGVNHIGHFLFTLLLIEAVIAAKGRIVNVASHAHYQAKGFDWKALKEPTKSATGMPEYQESKVANVLFTAELDRRLEGTGVTTYSLHPGVVASDIWKRSWGGKIVNLFRGLIMISVEEGAQTTLHCATSPEAADRSGLYWDKCAPKTPSKLGRDKELAAELWAKSLEWTDAPDWPR